MDKWALSMEKGERKPETKKAAKTWNLKFGT